MKVVDDAQIIDQVGCLKLCGIDSYKYGFILCLQNQTFILSAMEQVENQTFLETLNQITWTDDAKSKEDKKVEKSKETAKNEDTSINSPWETLSYQYPLEKRIEIYISKLRY